MLWSHTHAKSDSVQDGQVTETAKPGKRSNAVSAAKADIWGTGGWWDKEKIEHISTRVHIISQSITWQGTDSQNDNR